MISRQISRKEFLQVGARGAAGGALPGVLLCAAPAVAAPSFAKVSRFSVPLPIPVKAPPVDPEIEPNTYHLTLRQTQQTLHLQPGQTTVWGYDDGTLGSLYPGPTIEAQKGTPTTVRYENRLLTTHLLPLDTSIVPEEDAPCGRSRICTVASCRPLTTQPISHCLALAVCEYGAAVVGSASENRR